MLNPDNFKIDHIIAHGGFKFGPNITHCKDGFMARTLMMTYLKGLDNVPNVFNWDNQRGDQNELNVFIESIKETDAILFLDVCFVPEVMNKISQKTTKILLIDHHESSIAIANTLPESQKLFNSDKCASVLVFETIFPNQSLPLGIRYIDAHDRGHFQEDESLPNKKAFVQALDKLRQTEDDYRILLDDAHVRNVFIPSGQQFIDEHNANIQEALSNTSVISNIFTDKDGKTYDLTFGSIPISTHTIISDVGNQVTTIPGMDFAVTLLYDPAKNTTSCSFRTDEKNITKKVTALQVVQMLDPSSGGHPNAAGLGKPLLGKHIVFPLDQFMKLSSQEFPMSLDMWKYGVKIQTNI